MKAVIQAKLGMIAIIAGIVGTMFGVGGVENSVDTEQLIASVGVAFTGLMLMYAGVQLVKEA